MAMTNRSVVIGVFSDRSQAEAAIDELHRLGIRDDQIGFAWKGEGEIGDTSTKSRAGENKAAGGLGAGAVVGGILGAAAALLIPGVGPVLAGGILAPLLGAGATAAGVAAAGALAGAAAGGLVGALAGLGIPEEEARYYENEFNAGRVLVTVRNDSSSTQYDEILNVLKKNGAYDIQRPAGTTPPTSTSPIGDERIVEVSDSSMIQRESSFGTEPTSSNPPTSGQRSMGERGVAGQTDDRTREMMSDERETTSSSTHTTIRGVSPTEQPTNVRETNRPRVTSKFGLGERVTGERVGEWDSEWTRYRDNWTTRYGASGGRWEDVEPYYRFGHESRTNPRFKGRRFEEIETELRRDWEQRNSGHEWNTVNPYIRDMWDSDDVLSESIDQERSVGQSVDAGDSAESRSMAAGLGGLPTSPDAEAPSARFTGTQSSDSDRRVEGRQPNDADQSSQINQGGQNYPPWMQASSEWRDRWSDRYGSSRGRWEDVEPAYRFGYESRNNPRFQNRPYSDIEPELRQDWERNNPGSAWDLVGDFVRDVFEGGRSVR